MPMLPKPINPAGGAVTVGLRRPPVVPAPSAASPELSNRPRRRTQFRNFFLHVDDGLGAGQPPRQTRILLLNSVGAERWRARRPARHRPWQSCGWHQMADLAAT